MDQQPVQANIDTTEQEPVNPVNIDTGVPSAPMLPPEVVSQRSHKIAAGLGDVLAMSADEIQQHVSMGHESDLRQQAASTLDQHNAESKQQDLLKLAQDPNTGIGEINQLNAPSDPRNTPVDPSTVMEKGYAKAHVDLGHQAMADLGGTVSDVHKELPNYVANKERQSSDLIAKNQLVLSTIQDSEATRENQSWWSWGADQAKTLATFGMYDEWKLRGWMENVPSISLNGLGSGSNLYEQSIALYRLPMDQFKDKLQSVYQQLKADNPGMASTWLHGMLGMSLSERMLGDLGTLANVATIPGAGAAAKLLGRAGKAALAIKDVTEVAKLAEPTIAEVKAAAGDIHGAAAQSASVDLRSDLQGSSNLGERAMDSLQSGMRANRAAINGAWVSQRGEAFTQEVKNRLDAEAFNRDTNVLEVAEKTAKVDRAQEVTSYEPAMQKIIAKMKEDGVFRGPANMIGDVVYKLYDQVTNTHWFAFQMRREDGQLFKTEEEARGAARANGVIPGTSKEYMEKLDTRIKDLSQRIDDVKGDFKGDRLKRYQNAVDFFASKAEEYRNLYGRDSALYSEIEAQHQEAKGDLLRAQNQASSSESLMHSDTAGLNVHFENQAELQKLLEERKDILRNGYEGHQVRDTGAGFYVELLKPLNETQDIFRDMLGKTTESRMQENWLGGIANWIRTPKETLSKLENQMREIATHGPSRLLIAFKKASIEFEQMKRFEWKEWKRAIDFARHDIDPLTGLRGYFKQDPAELEHWYLTNAKRLPTANEISAYFAYKGNVEAEAALRDIRSFSLKARTGVEQHRVYSLNEKGERVPSDFFEGVAQKEAPGGEATVMLSGEKTGQEKFMKANAIPKHIRDAIDKGELKVVRVFDPDKYPLKNFGKAEGKRVRWVLTKSVESKPISYQQIGRRGGGHFVYNYDHYLKAPNMTWDPVAKHWNYAGDHTLMPVTSQRVGNDFAKHMNAVSDLLATGNEDAAKAYHIKNELPMSWEDHHGLYKDSYHPIKGEKIPARMRPGDHVSVTSKDKLIIDQNKDLENKYNALEPGSFKDRTRQESDARQAVVEFTGERDAYEMFSVGDKGSRANPVFSYEPAEMVDPVATYNRALNRIIQSSFIDDYKIAAVEHWIEAAKDLMNVDTKDLRHSPFYYFNQKGIWRKDADRFAVLRFEAARMQINQFTGVPSKVDAFLTSAMNKLHDAIYNVSPGAANKMLQGAQLFGDSKPLALARAFTFHAKMGLFSIPQFWMQFTTAANVLAITHPRNIPSVLASTMFHQWTRMNSNPEFIAHLDKMATRMGMKAGEFTEARNLLLRSGFDNIGGEHAFLDTPWTSKIIENQGNKILQLGETPFREGARNTRIAAFFTAYKEFRAGAMEGTTFFGSKVSRRGSQFGQITKEDYAAILDRAADLDHNMSRAASSAMHTGVMSPFGQFTAYSLRLMELMTGKRLTWQEKTRLFGASSILYGVPLGGLGLYGYPLGDWMRDKAKQEGYNVGENFISTVFNEGLPSEIMKVITGDNYNISHWGAKGFDPAGELLSSDKHWWDIMGGAALSTGLNYWAESSGIRNWAMNAISGSQEKWPITTDDITGALGLKEITSANAVIRLWYALNIGKWLSKNGSDLADGSEVTPGKAIFQTFSGLVDQNIADITITAKALQNRKALNTETEKQFINLVHKSMHSREMGNVEQSNAFLQQAKVVMNVFGDYPLEKRGALMARAFEREESLIDRLDWDYFMVDTPASKRKTLEDQFQQRQKLKQGQQ